MEVSKKIFLFIVLLSIFGCFTGCKKADIAKPYLKVNTEDISTGLYNEGSIKNEFNYTLENINDKCSVEISFEFYNNGQLEKGFQKENEYTNKEKDRKFDIGFTETYPVIKDTGESYIIYAIKNNNYTKLFSINSFYSEITESNLETMDNFYPEDNIEYCLLTFYAGAKSDIKSIADYNNKNDFIIDNYKYVYLVKIKYNN